MDSSRKGCTSWSVVGRSGRPKIDNRIPRPFWSYEVSVRLFRSSTAAEIVILTDSFGVSDARAMVPARVPPRNPRSKPLYQTSFPVLPAARRNCTRYSRRPIPAGAYRPNREPTRISAPAVGMRSAPSRQTGRDPQSLERDHVSARRVPEATRPLRVSRPALPRSSRELRLPLRLHWVPATIPPQVMRNRRLKLSR